MLNVNKGGTKVFDAREVRGQAMVTISQYGHIRRNRTGQSMRSSFHATYGEEEISTEILEASQAAGRMVLCLERDMWTMIGRLRQATNEDAGSPPDSRIDGAWPATSCLREWYESRLVGTTWENVGTLNIILGESSTHSASKSESTEVQREYLLCVQTTFNVLTLSPSPVAEDPAMLFLPASSPTIQLRRPECVSVGVHGSEGEGIG